MNTIFFYGHDQSKYQIDKFRYVFSQWYQDINPFKGGKSLYDLSHLILEEDFNYYILNRDFRHREQYMMLLKALMFAEGKNRLYNLNIAEQIMKSHPNKDGDHGKDGDPKKCKDLGRKIKGFDPDLWDEFKFKIVVNGNYLQFSQNQMMKKILLDTGDSEIVEASPFDKIWGIGMTESKAKITPRDKWGENLLGKALMEVRSILKSKN